MDRLKTTLHKWTSPPALTPDDGIRYWQDRVLFTLLFIAAIPGFFVYLPSVVLSINEKLWGVAVADTIMYICVIVLFLKKTIPFKIRAVSIIGLSYIIGLILLIAIGPFSAGPVWIFAFPVFAAVLSGFVYSLIALSINGATLIFFGILISYGHMQWGYDIIHPLKVWVVICLNFMFLNTLITLSITTVLQGLLIKIKREKSILLSLKQKHDQLIESNHQRIIGKNKRRKAEAALRESEARYRRVFENLQDVYYETGLDGTILEISPSVENFFHYKRKALIGKSLYDFCTDSKERDDFAARLVKKGKINDFEIHLKDKDGPLRTCSITALLAGDDQGTPVKIIGSMRDISEKKQAAEERDRLQAQLAQSRKMESVGRLAGGVAHDFNNMLGVIMGHAEMALDQTDLPGPIIADLQEIRKAAGRSADLTRQLLAFARKQEIAPKVLNLNDAVEGMLKMLRRLIGENIELIWMPAADLGAIKMDPSQIDQILANLCINGRDAIAEVGKIIIETGTIAFDDTYCAVHAGFTPGTYILLAVSDNGCGMEKEILDNLFEPFFTTKKLGQGTGLGLAMIYGIVKQNSGFINVYSEPEHGTTFKIYLPCHGAVTVQPGNKGPADPVVRGHETILLVEDEPAILRMTTMMLERLGYTVLATGTPREAIRLAKLHTTGIHLLMTDVVMPEMNGRDLADALSSFHPNLKRLFMSGYTANVIALQGVLDEGMDFIQKPFAMQDLAVKVRAVLTHE